jgi:hypothetical protein
VFLHNVLYWLKPDLTPQERATFLAGIEDLKRLKSVRAAWFGTPSSNGEAIADRSYTHAIVMDLGDAAGHDAFQIDPEHDAIRKRIGGSWDKILIYDVEAYDA